MRQTPSKLNWASASIAIILTAATIVSTVAFYNIQRQKGDRKEQEDNDGEDYNNNGILVQQLRPIVEVGSEDTSDNHPVGMPLDGESASPAPSPLVVRKTRSVPNVLSEVGTPNLLEEANHKFTNKTRDNENESEGAVETRNTSKAVNNSVTSNYGIVLDNITQNTKVVTITAGSVASKSMVSETIEAENATMILQHSKASEPDELGERQVHSSIVALSTDSTDDEGIFLGDIETRESTGSVLLTTSSEDSTVKVEALKVMK